MATQGTGASGGTVRIFIASSEELRGHRDQFDLGVRQQGDRWLREHGLHQQPVRWEHFIDAVAATRLQDEYNRAVTGCDVFVMLFRSKVGAYTSEEFEKAFGQFQATGRPRIYTYFHDGQVTLGALDRAATRSLWDFQDRLKALGHFQTSYPSVDGLLRHFAEQLELLRADGHLGPARAAAADASTAALADAAPDPAA